MTTGSRAYDPTPRRLAEARREGRIARTRDVGTACASASFAALVASGAEDGRAAFGRAFAASVAAIEGGGDPGDALAEALRGAAFGLAPLLGVVALAALLAQGLQTGFFFGTGPFSARRARRGPSLVEAGRLVLRASLAVAAASLVLAREPWTRAALASSPRALEYLAPLLVRLGLALAASFAAVGAFDYLFERARLLRSLRMTREELLRELRETDARSRAPRREGEAAP